MAIDVAVIYLTMQICGLGIAEFRLLPEGAARGVSGRPERRLSRGLHGERPDAGQDDGRHRDRDVGSVRRCSTWAAPSSAPSPGSCSHAPSAWACSRRSSATITGASTTVSQARALSAPEPAVAIDALRLRLRSRPRLAWATCRWRPAPSALPSACCCGSCCRRRRSRRPSAIAVDHRDWFVERHRRGAPLRAARSGLRRHRRSGRDAGHAVSRSGRLGRRPRWRFSSSASPTSSSRTRPTGSSACRAAPASWPTT